MCTGDWLNPVISNKTFKTNVEAYIKKPIANKDLDVYLWKMENKWLGGEKGILENAAQLEFIWCTLNNIITM